MSAQYDALKTRLLRAVFGDQVGLLLFIGALAFFGLYWRLGLFINDNYAVANGLYNAANGHLRVTEIVYGPSSGAVPGMVSGQDGRYSRNVGQILVTLPVLWALEGIAAVADVRVVLVALWSSTILGFGVVLSRWTARGSLVRAGAAGCAVVAFALNLSVATVLETRWLAPLALQVTSILAAALTGVFLYRLISRVHDTRAGLVAGAIVAVATPVGFWASIPKRHTYMAMLVMATVYCFFRSREAQANSESLRFRALAYALVGLSTWIQAGEAFALFVSLLVVDLVTARSTTLRDLGILAGVFGLSLVPFLVTNLVIAGNPLMPPMLLPRYRPGMAVTGGSGGAGTSGGTTSLPIWLAVVHLLETTGVKALEQMSRFTSVLSRGLSVLTAPNRLMHIFVRSGYIERVASGDHGQAVNLALLEAMPVAGALVLVPRAVWRRVRARTWSSIEPTDLFVGVYGVSLTLFYIPRLPLHAMITVRYLLPVMPLLVYGAFRFASVREVLDFPRALGFAYGGTVLIGSQAILTYLIVRGVTVGEAAQVHAWVNLVAAAGLAGWVLVRPAVSKRGRPVGAVVFGVACGVTTCFLLLACGVYFASGSGFVLPGVEWLSERLVRALI
ncbi:glycosyltransferase family 39 protein [Halobium palmae]|uniref:Glycosyltransferase family 39 protein n=1 Tax=Halobium palmae TaxID=1776492 RepID=A0ABD5RWD7_9EURY